MPRVCPRCNNSFSDRIICPTCNVRLLPSGSAMYDVSQPPSGLAPAESGWQQTPLGRGLLGLMLAQGLFYGLQHLGSTIILGIGNPALMADWSHTPPEGWVWWLMLGIQILGVLIGGVMAGAGQRRAVLLGLFVGLVNGLIFLSAQVAVQQAASGQQAGAAGLSMTVLCGQLLAQTVSGALGGFLGSYRWKPVVPIVDTGTVPGMPPPRLTALTGAQRLFRPFRGRIAWVRVGVGIAVVALVSLWANWGLQMIIMKSQNSNLPLSLPSYLHYQIVTWQISVLGLIFGSAWAGATTRNGLKQGLLVGLASCVLLIFFQAENMVQDGVPQTILFRYFLPLNFEEWIGKTGNTIALTVLSVIPLAMLGGWFGSQLLPPLARLPRQQKRPFPMGP